MAICLASGALSASPVLSRLELIGGQRGLALTLGADAPFSITIHPTPAEKNKPSVISITCAGVIYGLNDYQFSSFPQGCPLDRITARENKEGNSVEITLQGLAPMDKNLRSKQKDNRWVVLLSYAPVNDFAWSAQSEPGKVPNDGAARPSGSAVGTVPPDQAPQSLSRQPGDSSLLEDITILHRERVEKIVFKFDGPTPMAVKSFPDRISVLFVNSKNSLPYGTFKSEKDWLVKSIILKDSKIGAATGLEASIFINREGAVKPLVQTFPDRLVIYSERETKQCLYLWSARNGTTLSYDFIAAQPYPVDYKHIEAQARADAKTSMRENGTFNVSDTPAPIDASGDAIQPAPPRAPPAPRVVRVVLIKDGVNVRSTASTSQSSKVVALLPLGAIGTQLGKKGPWLNIECGETRGWIIAASAMDSVKVSKAQWGKINSIIAAKEKRREKAREAQRLREEKKEQRQSAVIQKENSRREEKERLAHRASEKAAARVLAAQTREKSRVVALVENTDNLSDGLGDTMAASHGVISSKAPVSAEKPIPKTIDYHAYGRDPFLPLTQEEDGLVPSIENLALVGILFDAMDRIGLFENIRDKTKAYALRENDQIKNGYLLHIKSDHIVFLINELGISRTYTMKLNKEKDHKAYGESRSPASRVDGEQTGVAPPSGRVGQ
jgi:hypothetical protein